MTAHAITARANASINRHLRPGERGGTGGRGRERGALSEGAVVVTVTVTFVAELPTVTGFGETVQVASEGAPVQVKVTVPDNPASPPTLNV
jgi:phage tail tape-measure protein